MWPPVNIVSQKDKCILGPADINPIQQAAKLVIAAMDIPYCKNFFHSNETKISAEADPVG